MRSVRSLVVAVLAFIVLAALAVVLADGRVALVVGNSTYAHIGRLPNPDNDAADMSAALRRLGVRGDDRVRHRSGGADRGAARVHAAKRRRGRVAGLFYAGHGIENGVNYLVPVDARLERDVDVRFETVTVNDLKAWGTADVRASRRPTRSRREEETRNEANSNRVDGGGDLFRPSRSGCGGPGPRRFGHR